MRKCFAIFALLLGCLFMAQSSLAVAAVYRSCCLEDCKGPGHCVDAGCQTCQAPAAVAAEVALPSVVTTVTHLAGALWPSSLKAMPFDVWRPPDLKTLLV